MLYIKLDILRMVLKFIFDRSSIIVIAETILFKLWSHCHLCHTWDINRFSCYWDLSVCILYTRPHFASYQKNDIIPFPTNILFMFHKMVFNSPVTITVILADLCFSCIDYHLLNVLRLALLYQQLILSPCYPSSRCVKAFSLTKMLFVHLLSWIFFVYYICNIWILYVSAFLRNRQTD